MPLYRSSRSNRCRRTLGGWYSATSSARAGQQRRLRCSGEQGGDLTNGALRAPQHVSAQRGRTEAGRLAQRQHRLEAGEQAAELGAVLPRWQQERLEAVLELVIAADGKIRLARAEAGQRDANLVAKVAKQVQQLALPLARRGQQVVQLVQQHHPAADLAQQAQRLPVGRPAIHHPRHAKAC